MRMFQTTVRQWAFCLFCGANAIAQSLLAQANVAAGTDLDNEAKKALDRVFGREVKLGVGSFRLRLTFEDAAKLAAMPDQQFELGLHYYARKDFTNAFHWFEKSATNDDANAQYALSVLYKNGEGVAEDKDRSLLWLFKASREPSRDALYTLGLRQFEIAPRGGIGGDADVAAFWFERAAQLGDTKGIQHLRRVLPQLSDKKAFYLLRGEDFPDPEEEYRLLQGLGKVRVGAYFHMTGLTTEAISWQRIQTVVELRLRAAGIEVPSNDYKADLYGRRFPMLYVTLECVGGSNSGLVAWHAKAECFSMAQHLYLPFRATIWNAHQMGTIGKENLGSLATDVEELVDKFANDFLKANPKK